MSAQQWVVTNGGVFLSRLDLYKPRRGRNVGRLLSTFEWAVDPALALHFDEETAKVFAGIASNIGGSVHGVAPYVPQPATQAAPKAKRRKP